MRASEASELRKFSHYIYSKPAISLNILLILQILCRFTGTDKSLNVPTGGQSEGAKRPSGGRVGGGGGGSPSHGREIVQNLCLKTAFSCTLDTFIRGSLCSGIDQFPTLVQFHSFPNEFVSGKYFPFSFLSSFVLLADQWGGGGAWCILAIPVTVVQPRFVNGGKARGGCGECVVGRFFKICV